MNFLIQVCFEAYSSKLGSYYIKESLKRGIDNRYELGNICIRFLYRNG